MTTHSANVSPSLEESLRTELLALPFHEREITATSVVPPFALCISQLLEKLGYTQVQLTGRTDWKGRNQHGGGSGFDMTALAPAAVTGNLSQRRVVISLKQFQSEQKVYQRTLDELRGACLRVGASEALLITTGPVSPTVRAPQAAPLAPVTVLEGDELLGLLIQHRVGVTEVDGYLKLDTARFAELRQESAGNGRTDCQISKQAKATVETKSGPSLRIIVQVEPLVQSSTKHKSCS